jgi:hypothetical protein
MLGRNYKYPLVTGKPVTSMCRALRPSSTPAILPTMSNVAFGATRQAIAARDRTLPGRVTGKLYKAIEAMVWSAASRKEAAQVAGLSDHGLRQALRRPHVMAFYLSECEVLRVSGRAKRLHRLEELAAQNVNVNGAVAAIKAAEMIAEDPIRSSGANPSPGICIVIHQALPPKPVLDAAPRIIDAGE